MDQKVERLFQEKNLIFIATINLDGSPQLTPVWGDYQNGHVLVNTAEGRIKHRNVLHDSRVAVCVVAHDNPLDMITIRGKVIEIIPDYDYTYADKLTKKYLDLEKYPFKISGEKRITFKIKPEHVYTLPEISMNEG
jgi:PPOX class probable F420-dependent enzyme